MKRKDILYSINVQDVQDVAQREFDRELNDKEIGSVAARLGECMDWYEAVISAITQVIRKSEAGL
jgi:hypothetical protein